MRHRLLFDKYIQAFGLAHPICSRVTPHRVGLASGSGRRDFKTWHRTMHICSMGTTIQWDFFFENSKEKSENIKRSDHLLFLADRNTIRAVRCYEQGKNTQTNNNAPSPFVAGLFFSLPIPTKEETFSVYRHSVWAIRRNRVPSSAGQKNTTATQNNTENTRLFHRKRTDRTNETGQNKNICRQCVFLLFCTWAILVLCCACCALTKRRTCKLWNKFLVQ